jgi:hypothetical protein
MVRSGLIFLTLQPRANEPAVLKEPDENTDARTDQGELTLTNVVPSALKIVVNELESLRHLVIIDQRFHP